MIRQVLVVTCVSLGFSVPLFAQLSGSPLPPGPPVVLHQPYVATRVSESHNVLADGTKIDKESSVDMARDSLGRTWSHWTLDRDDHHNEMFAIYDPLTHAQINWCSCSKFASIKHLGDPRPTALPVKNPENFTAYLGNDTDGHLAYHATTLPPQTIFGITTRGSLAVRKVAAGKEGNSKTLTTTVSSWYSEDLRMALDTIIDDPVKGITRYHFSKLDRIEPPAELFRPPPLPLHEVPAAPGLEH